MKNLYLITASILILALVGCDSPNEENASDMTNDNENEELVENQSDEMNDQENDHNKEEVDDEVEIDQGGGMVEEEEVEPLYEIKSIGGVNVTVQPMEGTDAKEDVVLLTFDDVFLSKHVYALEIAEILAGLDAKAIFFVNGLYIDSEENKEILMKMHDMGFEIGNHSMTHPNFSQISEEEQREQIIQLNNKVEEIIGERPRFFRAPFGINTDVSKRIVEEENMQWMNWSYGFDFVKGYMEATALTEIMLDPGKDGEAVSLSNGSNLLMHDRHFTRDAIEGIVKGLREKGYEIVDPMLIK